MSEDKDYKVLMHYAAKFIDKIHDAGVETIDEMTAKGHSVGNAVHVMSLALTERVGCHISSICGSTIDGSLTPEEVLKMHIELIKGYMEISANEKS